ILKPGGRFALADNITLPDAQSAKFHNDFERLRDPSHQQLVALVELEDQLMQAGFEVLEFVELSKSTGFEPWVDRQRCSAQTKERWRQVLANMPKALEMLMAPKIERGNWR